MSILKESLYLKRFCKLGKKFQDEQRKRNLLDDDDDTDIDGVPMEENEDDVQVKKSQVVNTLMLM